MDRDTFSIEHKEAWLDSEDPVGMYFDLDNISFSHHSCNVRAARRTNVGTSKCGSKYKFQSGCKCEVCKQGERDRGKARYTPERRREQYKRTGK